MFAFWVWHWMNITYAGWYVESGEPETLILPATVWIALMLLCVYQDVKECCR